MKTAKHLPFLKPRIKLIRPSRFFTKKPIAIYNTAIVNKARHIAVIIFTVVIILLFADFNLSYMNLSETIDYMYIRTVFQAAVTGKFYCVVGSAPVNGLIVFIRKGKHVAVP